MARQGKLADGCLPEEFPCVGYCFSLCHPGPVATVWPDPMVDVPAPFVLALKGMWFVSWRIV